MTSEDFRELSTGDRVSRPWRDRTLHGEVIARWHGGRLIRWDNYEQTRIHWQSVKDRKAARDITVMR